MKHIDIKNITPGNFFINNTISKDKFDKKQPFYNIFFNRELTSNDYSLTINSIKCRIHIKHEVKTVFIIIDNDDRDNINNIITINDIIKYKNYNFVLLFDLIYKEEIEEIEEIEEEIDTNTYSEKNNMFYLDNVFYECDDRAFYDKFGDRIVKINNIKKYAYLNDINDTITYLSKFLNFIHLYIYMENISYYSAKKLIHKIIFNKFNNKCVKFMHYYIKNNFIKYKTKKYVYGNDIALLFYRYIKNIKSIINNNFICSLEEINFLKINKNNIVKYHKSNNFFALNFYELVDYETRVINITKTVSILLFFSHKNKIIIVYENIGANSIKKIKIDNLDNYKSYNIIYCNNIYNDDNNEYRYYTSEFENCGSYYYKIKDYLKNNNIIINYLLKFKSLLFVQILFNIVNENKMHKYKQYVKNIINSKFNNGIIYFKFANLHTYDDYGLVHYDYCIEYKDGDFMDDKNIIQHNNNYIKSYNNYIKSYNHKIIKYVYLCNKILYEFIKYCVL